MCGGTERMGLMTPGRMPREGASGPRLRASTASAPRWHFLYLVPLPHQHGSFGLGNTAGGVRTWEVETSVMSWSYSPGGRIAHAFSVACPGSRRARTHRGG